MAVAAGVYRWREFNTPYQARAIVEIQPAEEAPRLFGEFLDLEVVPHPKVGGWWTLYSVAPTASQAEGTLATKLEVLRKAIELREREERERILVRVEQVMRPPEMLWDRAALDKLLDVLQGLRRRPFRVVAVIPSARIPLAHSLRYSLVVAGGAGLLIAVAVACLLEYARATGLFQCARPHTGKGTRGERMTAAGHDPLSGQPTGQPTQWFP